MRIILKGSVYRNHYLIITEINVIDMIISVKETTVFSVFHPDAQDLYNTCSDLKRVAYELWDPSFRLNAEVKEFLSARIYIPSLI